MRKKPNTFLLKNIGKQQKQKASIEKKKQKSKKKHAKLKSYCVRNTLFACKLHSE